MRHTHTDGWRSLRIFSLLVVALLAVAPLAQADVEAWLDASRQGEPPHVDEVDAAIEKLDLSAARAAALRVRRAVQLEKGTGAAGVRELHRTVTGHPARALAALRAQPLEVDLQVARVDAALGVLEANASPEDVATAIHLAALRLGDREGARGARERLERILERTLDRDEKEARRSIVRVFRDSAPDLAPAFADALSARPSATRMSGLVELLGQQPKADGPILNRLERLAVKLGPQLSDHELGRVRAYLESTNAFERRCAARSLGFLQDRESVATLIDLLRDSEAAVRSSAHDALAQISRLTIGPSYTRWKAWHAREREWWTTVGRGELAELATADRRRALEILRAAAQHRLYRRETTEAVLPLLESDDETLVRLGLATLEAVRARDVALDLVRLLEHESDDVRRQALTCLRALEGVALGDDPHVWRRYLQD